MKKYIYLLALIPLASFGQQLDIEDKVDSLQYVQDMPFICRDNIENPTPLTIGCGDKLFWDIVKLKMDVVNNLINRLDDSTITKAKVPLQSYNYSVADIAYTALKEIIQDIPTYQILGIKFDWEGCGNCAYWRYLNQDFQNRQNFKKAVKEWFLANKDDLIWVKGNSFTSCDYLGTHPNGGHFELKK